MPVVAGSGSVASRLAGAQPGSHGGVVEGREVLDDGGDALDRAFGVVGWLELGQVARLAVGEQTECVGVHGVAAVVLVGLCGGGRVGDAVFGQLVGVVVEEVVFPVAAVVGVEADDQ